eukprot:3459113-Amphidinium_carterae.1
MRTIITCFRVISSRRQSGSFSIQRCSSRKPCTAKLCMPTCKWNHLRRVSSWTQSVHRGSASDRDNLSSNPAQHGAKRYDEGHAKEAQCRERERERICPKSYNLSNQTYDLHAPAFVLQHGMSEGRNDGGTPNAGRQGPGTMPLSELMGVASKEMVYHIQHDKARPRASTYKLRRKFSTICSACQAQQRYELTN